MLCKQIFIAITGPTASGKTAVGIQLAEALGQAEIISADSRQVYRFMDIGTAKPTKNERERARHHFLDVKNPDQTYSAGDFGKEARGVMKQLWRGDSIPLLIGGSGLYLQAALEGLFVDEPDLGGIRKELMHRLKREGLPALYDDLEREDPVARREVNPNDAPRIMRALEMAYKGKKGGTKKKGFAGLVEGIPLIFCLGMDRERLYQRIDKRVEVMMENGLVEEVEGLIKRGYGRECPGLGTLGYAETLDFIDGLCRFKEAKELIKSRSRKYAKRQLTWFRRDRRLRWLDLDRWGEKGIIERILAQYQAENTNT